MRLSTRLKHRALRLLGVVSPSGRYPLPPDWAMNRDARQRWAADLAAGPMSTRLCGVPCGSCAASAAPAPHDGANGRERGTQA